MARRFASLRGVPTTVQDGALAFSLAAVSVVSVAVAARHCDCDRPSFAAYCLLAASCLPLIWRRTHPVLVWAVVGVATAAYGLTSYADPPLYFAAIVGVYSVAAHAPRRWAVAAAAVTLLAIGSTAAVDPQPTDLNDVVPPILEYATAWLLGDSLRTRRAYLDELEQRAERLARDRDDEVRRAASEERSRIARELHDVAAHHVSVIAVQAEAGRSLLPDHPEHIDGVLATISGSARDAMRELRRLLGVLRTDAAASDELAPQPSLGDVDQLVGSVRHAGIDVTCQVNGTRGVIADGLDLAGYRIIQEALTNVVKHSGARAATVTIDYRDDAVEITVADDGDGTGRVPAIGTGHGLSNMRERVAVFGGEIRVGRRPGGGFLVEAVLPR